jgi:hypothetical protein
MMAKWTRLSLAALLACALWTAPAFAHTANEKTLYDDIEFSKAKAQIVELRALNVIPLEKGVKLYRPEEKLTKKQLRAWAEAFRGQPVSKVASDDTPATYADVNAAYFDGKAKAEHPEQNLTKEEFALWMGTFVTEKVEGKTLLDQAAYTAGPSGKVEKVVSRTEGSGQEAYKVYTLTIGGKEYEVAMHPMLLNAPTDLALMEGKTLQATWSSKEGLKFLEATPGQFEGVTDTQHDDHQQGGGADASDGSPGMQGMIYVGLAVLVGILVWMGMGRRKKK